jgi:hypothetical protein
MAARGRAGDVVRALWWHAAQRTCDAPVDLAAYSQSIPTHRNYQTIYPLSELLGVPIENPYPEGQESTQVGRGEHAADIARLCDRHAAPLSSSLLGARRIPRSP